MERRVPIGIILILAVYLFINISSLSHRSATFDEARHYKYGLQISALNSDRNADDSKMPFSVLNTIPLYLSLVAAQSSPTSYLTPYLQSLNAARIVTIWFALILAYYVFAWSRALYGTAGGFFSLLLFVLEPNLLAHSGLVTTDLYAALMVTVSLFYFWIFLRDVTLRNGIVCAFTLGLSQLAKYSAIFLYPLFGIILCMKYVGVFIRSVREKDSDAIRSGMVAVGKYTALFMAISVLIINVGFLFNGTFTPLAAYTFKSHMFNTLKSIPLLDRVPLPFPVPFIEGLDRCKYNDSTGESYGNIYLLGQLRDRKGPEFSGFMGYFAWCYLLKVPIATQLFLLLAVWHLLRHWPRENWLERELLLLVAVGFFAIYFNVFFNTQIGIRYIIIIFPLLHILCGVLLKRWGELSYVHKAVYVGLAVNLMLSVASYYPHYLSYFNEFVWDRRYAYQYLADSNIDWGQSDWYVRHYQREHPEVVVAPRSPTVGRILIGVNELVGVYNGREYRWLRENFEPIDHVAYSHLVFDIDEADVSKLARGKAAN